MPLQYYTARHMVRNLKMKLHWPTHTVSGWKNFEVGGVKWQKFNKYFVYSGQMHTRTTDGFLQMHPF